MQKKVQRAFPKKSPEKALSFFFWNENIFPHVRIITKQAQDKKIHSDKMLITCVQGVSKQSTYIDYRFNIIIIVHQ